MFRIGLILLLFGILYIVRPDIYRRWIWKKTDIAQQRLSPEQYKRSMRVFGILMAVAGLTLLAICGFKP